MASKIGHILPIGDGYPKPLRESRTLCTPFKILRAA